MTYREGLNWPTGWPRTAPVSRKRSQFKLALTRARRELVWELERWGASQLVISTNLPLRLDGLPRADARAPDDPGVAVWFYWRRQQRCVACDRYDRVQDNLTAILRTIEATRALSRWGAISMEQSAQMFTALPPPGEAPWHVVLGVEPTASGEEIKDAFRAAATAVHPDKGGDTAAMQRLVQARDAGLRARTA